MPSGLRIAALGVMLIAYPLVGAAQVPQSALGTWKLNVAKSKYSPGPAPRSQTTRIEAVPGGGTKLTVDSVDGAGKTVHNEIVTTFDGKEAAWTGAAAPTTRAYSRVDDRNFQWVERVNGKVTTTGRSSISADGKTRTNSTTGTGADGKPVNNTTVLERQ
jgi:hypothetical protein